MLGTATDVLSNCQAQAKGSNPLQSFPFLFVPDAPAPDPAALLRLGSSVAPPQPGGPFCVASPSEDVCGMSGGRPTEDPDGAKAPDEEMGGELLLEDTEPLDEPKLVAGAREML